jgi:hypothetical protein
MNYKLAARVLKRYPDDDDVKALVNEYQYQCDMVDVQIKNFERKARYTAVVLAENEIMKKELNARNSD